MKFRIKHESKLFHYGIIVPWIAALTAIIIFIALGFTIEDKTAALVLLCVLILCSISVVIFTVLFIIQMIFGTTITIQNDLVDIRILFRHKRLYFANIVKTKYTHYYDNENANDGSDIYTLGPRLRSKLIFTLDSGKHLILNDKATGYKSKRNLWITNPEIDPDEDVKLYQAYRCFCSLYNRYKNTDHTGNV